MSLSASVVSMRRAAFKKLHCEGCFVIPNPWDIGSAKLLARMGFKALATTSSGAAWSQGKADGSQSRDDVIEHVKSIVEATSLPVNADFGNGYGKDSLEVASSVALLLKSGVAGLSIEDATGDSTAPLFAIDVAFARMQAARSAIDDAGGDAVLVGRAENFLVGDPDLDRTIERLKAYAQAGAHCLYAPGIKDPDEITRLVAAVAPMPVNLLVGAPSPLTVEGIARLGVRRISVGGAFARVAYGALSKAALDLAESGRFDGFAGGMAGAELNSLFG